MYTLCTEMEQETRTPKAEEVKHLECYYKRAAEQPTADDAEGDDLANFGEY